MNLLFIQRLNIVKGTYEPTEAEGKCAFDDDEVVIMIYSFLYQLFCLQSDEQAKKTTEEEKKEGGGGLISVYTCIRTCES